MKGNNNPDVPDRWSAFQNNSQDTSIEGRDSGDTRYNTEELIASVLSGTPRVLQGGKENRKAVTVYLSEEVKYEIDSIQNQWKREFTPDPRKLDVYAAIFYAGLPDIDCSAKDFLRSFRYEDD